jgi:hypothetical protein
LSFFQIDEDRFFLKMITPVNIQHDDGRRQKILARIEVLHVAARRKDLVGDPEEEGMAIKCPICKDSDVVTSNRQAHEHMYGKAVVHMILSPVVSGIANLLLFSGRDHGLNLGVLDRQFR